MKNFTLTALLALAFLVYGTSQSYSAEAAPKVAAKVAAKAPEKPAAGNIRVLKITGDVTRSLDATKQPSALKEGSFIQQDEVITTGKNSKALLLMSNGTTLTVDQNSSFHVDKFLQTPFDSSNVDYKTLKAEPSTSQTKLDVKTGSVIADVCKLSKGSTFDILTPVGVAGIRGTIIKVTVTRPGGGGPVTVSIDMPRGKAEFKGIDGKTVTLSDGTTITVQVQADGTSATPAATTPMPKEQMQEIQALVKEAMAIVPEQGAFEGAPAGAPEQGDQPPSNGENADTAGGLGGDQGAGDVGTAPTTGGSGGGGSSGGGGNPTPTPTPNPPVS